MLCVTINGKSIRAPEDVTILDALQAARIEIPTLCHDSRLVPIGACRLCVVKVKGAERPVTACNNLIADGMEIETHSSEIEQVRRTLLRLLANNYPPEAVAKSLEDEFHRYIRQYNLESELRGEFHPELRDDSHPDVLVDMSRCVYCYRCVRICDEVSGPSVWRVWNRGGATRILPDSGTTLLESSCISCRACVSACPSGALR